MQSQNYKIRYPAHGVVIPDLYLKIDLQLEAKERREARVLRALTPVDILVRKRSLAVKQLGDISPGGGLHPGVRQMAAESS
jgi:hypothetical protein